MQRHKLATLAQGVAGMHDICNLLNVGIDPVSTFQEYTEVIGNDLNGAPIEAGLPQATWAWDVMSQSDFQYLLNFIGATGSGSVYVRTRNNSGESGYDFANYLAVMTRPVAEEREGLLMRGVTVTFLQMEIQS